MPAKRVGPPMPTKRVGTPDAFFSHNLPLIQKFNLLSIYIIMIKGKKIMYEILGCLFLHLSVG